MHTEVLEYGEKTENHGKLEIHTLGREIWRGKLNKGKIQKCTLQDVEYGNNLGIMENEKHPLDDLKNDEITEKRET